VETTFVLGLPDGSEFTISHETRVGSASPCEIVLPDPNLSPRHATLWVQNDSLFLRDDGSEAGTFVNEARLSAGQPFQLRVGDRLRLAATVFSVAAASAHGVTAPPPDVVTTALGMSPVAAAVPTSFALLLPDGRRFNLTRQTRVGRDLSCNIRLDDAMISGHHATLWLQQNVLYLRDEHSTNGTFLNDTRLPAGEPAPLRPGDRLRLGRTDLTVVAATGREAEAPAAPASATMVEFDVRQTVRLNPPTPPPAPSPAAWVVRGPDLNEHFIQGEMLVGREQACPIKLIDPRASRRHAVLFVQHGALLVRDENSRNGTFVNQARLAPGQVAALRPGDNVRFADSEFTVLSSGQPSGDSDPDRTEPTLFLKNDPPSQPESP
jgi:pSer/pThr/pTyr-binding forkhead associated (FHA) protein